MTSVMSGAKYMLMVADMSRAVAFYKNLGLAPAFESPQWSELKLAGGATVALHGGGTKADRDTGLSFDTADIQSACAAVAKAGGTITMAPQERPREPIVLAKARDTEGNAFSISQYKG